MTNPTTEDAAFERHKSGQLLWVFATGAGAIACATLLVEILTDRWMAVAMDLPVFMSLPLGLCALALGVLNLWTGPRTFLRAALPLVFAATYWITFLLFL